MYEVFFNDRKITIAAPGKITIIKPSQIIDYLIHAEDVKRWFLKFIENDIPKVLILHSAPDIFFKTIFQQVFTSIPAAGGIVIRKNKLLFIFRNEKWDLPKGKIDAGETNREAALREVNEECGISKHKIIKQLPSTFHIFQSPYKKTKGQWIFKETFWFEMEYPGVENGHPQIEENITETRWFDRNELNLPFSNTYANLKSVISK